MKISHVHCRVRDLPAAVRWFQKILHANSVFNNERMVWLGFGDFGVILDAAPADSALTIGFDSEDCDADYRTLISLGHALRLPHGPRRPNHRARTAVEKRLSLLELVEAPDL
jgi:catechol 2,3-dioxygenase-like lactoylglutathione lyase family enzyme